MSIGETAGNVVAGRLAENPSVSVLVVEAGPGSPREEAMILTPARAFELHNSKYDWGKLSDYLKISHCRHANVW